MRTTFSKVEICSSKSGICPICKKRAERRKTFCQTVNPWNTDSEGNMKTREIINSELRVECRAWKSKPVLHARCETIDTKWRDYEAI
jgi:hypothetical protein